MTAPSLSCCQVSRVLTVAGVLFLFLTGSSSARCFGVPEGNPEEVLWSVTVEARSVLGHKDGAVFGVSPSASVLYEEGLDELEPRLETETGLRLYFILEEMLNFPASKLNKSFTRALDDVEWAMAVEYRGTDRVQVILTWDVQEVLRASEPVELHLIDGGGTSVDMLSIGSHGYEATPGTAAFTVTAEVRGDTGNIPLVFVVIGIYGGGAALYILLRRVRRRSTRDPSSPTHLNQSAPEHTAVGLSRWWRKDFPGIQFKSKTPWNAKMGEGGPSWRLGKGRPFPGRREGAWAPPCSPW